MVEPADLEQYLRDITADMSRYDAFLFVHASLPAASGSWIAYLIGCHPSIINRYLASDRRWRCRTRRRKKYTRKEMRQNARGNSE